MTRPLTSTDLDLYEELAFSEAREDFFAFRKLVHPHLVVGWFVAQISLQLQRFYYQLMAGMRPKMLLMCPPQHGKTSVLEDFVAWLVGKHPNLKQMYTSYSEDLGLRVNAAEQRILDDPVYAKCFGQRLAPIGDRKYARNSSQLEFIGYPGMFRNTTVLGQITGQALDLGIIDDPIKGRKEAQSELQRNSVWSWLTDDFFTRFSDAAGMLLVQTRWHTDDPAGRFLQHFPSATVVKYPAVAEQDEIFRKHGEPLFPEFKSIEFLMERKKLLTNSSWLSLYQQSPIVQGGGMFPVEKFDLQEVEPATAQVKKIVRYWDKAGTADGGAYTAGVKMMHLKDGTFTIADVRRGQWSALDREKIILQTARMDGTSTRIEVEQEPGSAGKESAERTIRMLSGFKVGADRVTGPKEVRAEPYAAQVQAGNISLVNGGWVREFLNEHEEFPNGPFKDQVDAAGGAFTKLTLGRRYDSSLSWVE